MLSCDEVRQLAEEYVEDTLDPARRAEVARHLLICQPCHTLIDEARLAKMVLDKAGPPPPPVSLADSIKHAAMMRLRYRPRPLHERALGSPAFLATLASLLCGAIICLIAIFKVATVGPWLEAPVPQVSVVEKLKLPAREPYVAAAPLTAPLTTPTSTVHRSRRTPRRSLVVATNASAPVRVARPTPAAPSRRIPPAPITAGRPPAPRVSLAPSLPTPDMVMARERISQPESIRHASFVESNPTYGIPGDGLMRPEVFDLTLPYGSPRTDFTGAR